MRVSTLLTALLTISLTSCNTIAGDTERPPHIPFGDPLPGHVSFWSWPDLEDWAPKLLDFEPDRAGELLGLDLGALGEFSGGLSGLRARIAPLEIALGTPLMPPDPPDARTDSQGDSDDE